MAGKNGNGAMDIITANQFRRAMNGVLNTAWTRTYLGRELHGMDPRKDIDDECGYPKTSGLTVEFYQEMYDRSPYGERAVEVLPKESWAIQPSIHETETETEETDFESAWKELGKSLSSMGTSKSWYQDEEGSSIWAWLLRADILAGIGRYGILLLGLDDGKELKEEALPGKNQKLIYLRAYSESGAKVIATEKDRSKPNYGWPTIYSLETEGESQQVHASRVIHIADSEGPSVIYAQPRQQSVWNHLYNLRKLHGAGPEGYWQSGLPTTYFKSDPRLDPSQVTFDSDTFKDEIEKTITGLQKYMTLIGWEPQTLGSNVGDPGSFIEREIDAICVGLSIPKRIFLGSERGELASGQDARSWNARMTHRCKFHCTPAIITPFIDRLIYLGVLPEPKGFSVDWPDIDQLTPEQEAALAKSRMEAYAKYLGGGVEALLAPEDFLVREMGYSQDEAIEILEAAEEAQPDEPEPPQIPPTGPPQIPPGPPMQPQDGGPKPKPTQGPPGQPPTENYNPNQPRDSKGRWGSGGGGGGLTLGQDMTREEVIDYIVGTNPPEQISSGKLTKEEWADKFLSEEPGGYTVMEVHPKTMNLPMSAGDPKKVDKFVSQSPEESPPIVVDSNDKIQARIGGGRLDQAYGLQEHTVVDGKHRLEASLRRGDKSIKAVVPKRKADQLREASHRLELSEYGQELARKKGVTIDREEMTTYGPRFSGTTKEGYQRNWGPSDLERMADKRGDKFKFVSNQIYSDEFGMTANTELPPNAKLNQPFRTPNGPKKFGVYTKGEKGNTVLVRFGDPDMEIKRDDPERRKNFRARHGCDNPGPKWKAKYWACKFWSSKSVSKLVGNYDDVGLGIALNKFNPNQPRDSRGRWSSGGGGGTGSIGPASKTNLWKGKGPGGWTQKDWEKAADPERTPEAADFDKPGPPSKDHKEWEKRLSRSMDFDSESNSVDDWMGSNEKHKELRDNIAKGKLGEKEKKLLTAISKAPRYQGTVYRGEVTNDISHLKSNEVLYTSSLTSTSAQRHVAVKSTKYARGQMGATGTYDVVYSVSGVKHGRDISGKSRYGQRPYTREKEVVVQKGAKMKITSVKMGKPDRKTGRILVEVNAEMVKE